ncbi:MAG: DUF3794 domain-containing protein [Clostridia bacterium]|nr:DUF3794 domain-containing protein [Clostridia bacterium]
MIQEKEIHSIANSVYTLLSNNTQQTDIGTEFSLPDYLPDIRKVLRILSDPQITGRYMSDEKLELEGNVSFTLIYLSEENTIRSFRTTAAFEQSFAINGMTSDTLVTVNKTAEHSVCRLTGPRRCTFRCRLRISVRAISALSVKPEICQIPAGTDRQTLSTKTVTVKSCLVYPLPDAEMRYTEDIRSSDGPISEVLSYEVHPIISDVRVQNGSILCKGEFLITVLCSISDENDTLTYQTLQKRIPFTEMNDDEKIRDSFRCDPDISVTEISCTITEEGRNLGVDFNTLFCAVCYEETNVPIITDAFLPSYDIRIQSEERPVFLPYRMLFGNMAVSGQIKFDTDEKPHSITDCIGHVVFERTELSDKRSCTNGYIDVSAILQTEEHHFIPVNGTVPIRWECDTAVWGPAAPFIDPSQLLCHVDGGILNTGCRIDHDQHCIVFDAEVSLSLYAATKTTVPIPVSLSVPPDAKKIPPSPCPVVLYYPQQGEAIWDIAKEYRVSPEQLCETNRFSEDTDTVPQGTRVMLIQQATLI